MAREVRLCDIEASKSSHVKASSILVLLCLPVWRVLAHLGLGCVRGCSCVRPGHVWVLPSVLVVIQMIQMMVATRLRRHEGPPWDQMLIPAPT